MSRFRAIPYAKALLAVVEDQAAERKEAVADALREVQKAGVEVIYPDKTPFRESVREMHESYRGTPVYSLLTEIAGIQ